MKFAHGFLYYDHIVVVDDLHEIIVNLGIFLNWTLPYTFKEHSMTSMF